MNSTVRAWLVVGTLVGCKNDQDIVRQEVTDIFYQEPSDEVDILWVVDNSISMADEQAAIAAKFNDFIVSLEASNIDFHIGVVTTDLDDPDQNGKLISEPDEPLYITLDTPNYEALFQSRVQVGVDGADREKGIDAAYVALSEPLVSSFNNGFLRPEAALSIIYVSDENDCTDRGALSTIDSNTACYDYSDELVSVRDLIDDYDTLKDDEARTLVSAIVGPEIVENCDGAKPGFRYEAMAEAFGGLQGSICSESFASIMENLGLQVSGVLTSFQLSNHAIESSIEIYVNEDIVEPDELNGWTYDNDYAIVYFHGSGIPARGSQIYISYEVGGS